MFDCIQFSKFHTHNGDDTSWAGNDVLFRTMKCFRYDKNKFSKKLTLYREKVRLNTSVVIIYVQELLHKTNLQVIYDHEPSDMFQ